jgi:eukaryotic-like serine/threonine-protein kinase
MVSGQRAFRGESIAATLAAVIDKEPQPLSYLSPAVPQGIEVLVRSCLRKDISRRAQHASDIKATLEELREDSTSGATVAPQRSVPSRPARTLAVAGGSPLRV